ncbi:hypothetical protein RIF29_28736 [Crotalaria pallida]|uniref:Uncharacterized protein n=1 Tax=Crotalaria pallida TaxID=3830 RepID=A0AAN9EDC0_CROPI
MSTGMQTTIHILQQNADRGLNMLQCHSFICHALTTAILPNPPRYHSKNMRMLLDFILNPKIRIHLNPELTTLMKTIIRLLDTSRFRTVTEAMKSTFRGLTAARAHIYISGCEIIEIHDEEETLMNDFYGRIKRNEWKPPKEDLRTVIGALDTVLPKGSGGGSGGGL